MKTPSKLPFYTLSSHFLTSLRILTCSPQKTCGVFSLNIQTKFWMAVRFVSTGWSKHLAYIKIFVYRCKYRNTNLDNFYSFLTLLLKVTCRRNVSVLCPPDRTYVPKAKQYIYMSLCCLMRPYHLLSLLKDYLVSWYMICLRAPMAECVWLYIMTFPGFPSRTLLGYQGLYFFLALPVIAPLLQLQLRIGSA